MQSPDFFAGFTAVGPRIFRVNRVAAFSFLSDDAGTVTSLMLRSS